MSSRRRLIVLLFAVAAVTMVGTIGLMLLEGWDIIDALYMAVITIATVGFGEVRPLSPVGHLFIIGLIIVGVGTVATTISTLAEFLLEEQINPHAVRLRRMRQRVKHMTNHVIVCGYGRVGAHVVGELTHDHVPVVVIDSDPATVDRCAALGMSAISGDASDDAVLKEAGIERARGLVVTTNSDANNVYVTLAARALAPSIYIVARVDRDEAAARLTKAGANRVISPYHLGGRRMASLVVRPAVVDFVDTMLQSKHGPLRMEEVEVLPDSRLADMRVADLRQALNLDVSILAIIKPGDTALANPPAATQIAGGDILIVLGNLAQLPALERHCGHASREAHS